MATIQADGMTRYGEQHITIKGEEAAQEFACSDPMFLEAVKSSIDAGDGWMANAYYPPPGTMLQALATLCVFFGDRNVTVSGDIGELPEVPSGVIC